MTRRIPIAALALAAAAAPASAQTVAFRAPIRLSAVSPGAPYSSYFYSLAPYSTAAAPDLFVGLPAPLSNPALGDYFPHETPLASGPLPFPSLPNGSTNCFAAGNWGNGDDLADLAWCWGGVWYEFSGGYENGFSTGDEPSALVFAHLLDAPGNVLVAGMTTALQTWVLFSSTPAVPSSYRPFAGFDLGYPIYPGGPATTFALQRTRLGPVARGVAPGSAGKGIDDLVWSRNGLAKIFVVWTSAVLTGFTSDSFPGAYVDLPGALEAHGAGALDVDGDGIPDLVVAVANVAAPGQIVAVRNDGVLADLDSGTRTDLTAALGLADPALAEPLEIDGIPAVAIWDEALAQIAVATRDPARGVVTWTGAADPTRSVRRILGGDVTGSAAPDLVVGYADGALDVFPGAFPPAVGWSAALPPPAHASRAAGFQAGVDASADPAGSVARVDLLADGSLVGSSTSPPYLFPIPPASLATAGCALSLVARATDDLGIAREVAASVVLDLDPPAVTLTQGSGPVPVALAPGGTRFSVAATAFDPCSASIDFQWSQTGLTPGATTSPAGAGASSRLDVLVPESDYPALVARLDRTARFAVVASNAVASSPAATEVVEFDGSGLLAISQVADRAALAPGDLALLTTTVASVIGVDLPQVRLDTELLGLVPAGPARVQGAALLSEAAGSGGPNLTLDRIPGGGAPVTIELAVQRAMAGGGASGAQARSAASGAALSPAVSATPPQTTPPGLSCGQAGTSPLALLAAWLYMKAIRRVPARTRSTSSSTPMRRQA
jgi:hypothetical protein